MLKGMRLMPGPPGHVSLLRRPGLGPDGLLQGRRGVRSVDPARDVSLGQSAGVGVDYRVAGI